MKKENLKETFTSCQLSNCDLVGQLLHDEGVIVRVSVLESYTPSTIATLERHGNWVSEAVCPSNKHF